MNSSSVNLQPNANDGNKAYLLFIPNLEEPSERNVPVNKYFPLYE